MFKWLDELINLRLDYLDRKAQLSIRYCESCEVLKIELAHAHEVNTELLKNITAKPEPEKKIDISELKPIMPARHLPFNVRKQMMEQEDRRKAAILQELAKDNSKPVQDETKISSASTEVDSELTAELEKELDVAQEQRLAETGMRK